MYDLWTLIIHRTSKP